MADLPALAPLKHTDYCPKPQVGEYDLQSIRNWFAFPGVDKLSQASTGSGRISRLQLEGNLLQVAVVGRPLIFSFPPHPILPDSGFQLNNAGDDAELPPVPVFEPVSRQGMPGEQPKRRRRPPAA